jgi:tRNA-specific 2-thiouridylase
MENVILAMSGGIDSSVALYLLKKEGFNVRGFTMQNGSMSEKEIKDAQLVARQNDVEWELVDIEKEFKKEIEKYFIETYAIGMTPNPCAVCNRKIKFGLLIEMMRRKYGDVYYATGHYARIVKIQGNYFFSQATDLKKDQSYFLSTVKKEYLPKIIFPLADLTKAEVRKIAEQQNIRTAKKPDSQEICFIPEDDYRKYLLDHGVQTKRGNFVFVDGTVMGTHDGTCNYTIGQRKGLGISYSEKLFVKEIKVGSNEVILDVHQNMYHTGLIADRLNMFINMREIGEISQKMLKCKVRSNSKPVNVKIKLIKDKLEVLFEEKQFAVSPGQLCVIYCDEKVVLSGRIIAAVEKTEKE